MTDRLNFQRLDDNSWGVKVQSMRSSSRHMSGREVSVTKRDGSSSTVTLGGVASTWRYANTLVTVYRIRSRR